MCLLGVQFQVVPDVPVLLLANREEAYDRPASGPAVHAAVQVEAPSWFGGVDLLAGGTWLGVNACKLIVAVTNRSTRRPLTGRRSRGLLCRDLLNCRDVAAASELAVAELHRTTYAGCNLLLVSPHAANVIEAGDELRMHELSPGLHLVSNGDWDFPNDVRLNFARHELQQVPCVPVDQWLSSAGQLCGRRASGGNPPICLEFATGGTVSASLITLGSTAESTRYRHCQGPPSTTPFVDYSTAFNEMLGQSLRL